MATSRDAGPVQTKTDTTVYHNKVGSELNIQLELVGSEWNIELEMVVDYVRIQVSIGQHWL